MVVKMQKNSILNLPISDFPDDVPTPTHYDGCSELGWIMGGFSC
jgi:hypothetical protein